MLFVYVQSWPARCVVTSVASCTYVTCPCTVMASKMRSDFCGILYVCYLSMYSHGQEDVRRDPLVNEATHTQTLHTRYGSSGRVIGPSQTPLSENKYNKHPCPRRDSNPQSQQAIGCRTARPATGIGHEPYISIINVRSYLKDCYFCLSN
jgi:hypothetical protein